MADLIKSLRELVVLTRIANARLCVAHNLHTIERSKAALEKAYAALDEARADDAVLRHQPAPSLPEWLKKVD